MSTTPPPILENILARVIPRGASGPSLLGDLAEEFAVLCRRRGGVVARGWYLIQVVTIGAPYAIAAVWRRVRSAFRHVPRGIPLDLRHTARLLWRHRVATGVSVISLTVGLGLTTAVVSVINGIWFAPLTYPSPDRLVDLDDTHPTEVCTGCSAGTSYPSYEAWRRDLSVFSEIAAMSGATRNLTVAGRTRDIETSAVSGNLARLLGIRMGLGRPIQELDERPGAAAVVVLSHGLWNTLFGGAIDVLGRTVQVDGVPHEVVGVLASETRLLDRARAWVPLAPTVDQPDYDNRGLWVVGRLADGVEVGVADQSLRQYAEAQYADAGLAPGWSARARPLRSVLVDETIPPMMASALFAATFLALLIAGFNLGALLLARVTERERELGIRLAIGSSRGRLLRLVMLESVIVAAMGGVGGLMVAMTSTRVISQRLAGFVPGWLHFPMDGRILVWAVGAVVLTAMICGTLPLLGALRLQPGEGVIRQMIGRHGPDRLRRHDWLLGSQIALGVILVAGSVVAMRTFFRVSDFDTVGHRYRDLVMVRVAEPVGASSTAASVHDLGTRIGGRLLVQPGVVGVVPTRSLFLGSWGSADGGSPVWAEGASASVPDRVVPRHSLAVGAGYFDLYQIPLVAGRAIDEGDGPGGEARAVVSVAAAGVLWPERTPPEVLDRRFRVVGDDEEQWFTVTGVAGDVVVNVGSESRRIEPRIYTALSQTSPTLIADNPNADLTFNLDVSAEGITAEAWETAVASVDPGLAVAGVITVEASLRRWITPMIITMWLMTVLSGLAVGLVLLGVYGTVSYRIATLRQEIGVRIALGARPSGVVHVVTGRVARVFAVGLIVGGGVSWALARGFAGSGIPLGGRDPVVLFAAALLLSVSGGLACVRPVRRALAINPIESLKTE